LDELLDLNVIAEEQSLYDVEMLRKTEITSDLERTALQEEVRSIRSELEVETKGSLDERGSLKLQIFSIGWLIRT
jgi:hypothetical protein